MLICTNVQSKYKPVSDQHMFNRYSIGYETTKAAENGINERCIDWKNEIKMAG